MNINAMRAEQRNRKIMEVIKSIKLTFEEERDIDYNKLRNEICFQQQVSRRTSQEYIDVALSQIEHEIIKKEGIKTICQIATTLKEEEKNTPL